MNSSNTKQWDLGRFVKTLSYFGAIPVLSSIDWFQQMLGSRPDPKADRSILSNASGVVLVVGANSPGQQVVQRLVQQGYRVRSLVPLTTPDASTFSDQVEVIQTDLAFPNGVSPEWVKDVQAVIYCTDEGQGLPQLVDAIAQTPSAAGQMLFDFTHPTVDLRETWGALDDIVMGGVSESNMRLSDSTALFSGNVSTANSGGFASVRTRNFDPPLDLANAEGIELRVKGDGNRYKFMLRSENRWDGIAYCYSFDTVADTWITVRIPFSALIPVFRAKTVQDAGPVDPHRITAVQLMLSKFEYDGALNPHFSPGFFQLQIESIRTYTTEHLSRFVLVSSPQTSSHESFLMQRGVPYTIIRSTPSGDGIEGRSLTFTSDDLVNAAIDRKDVAELCVWAIAHPQACNTQFAINIE